MKENKKGFTLLEMVVVVLILSVLFLLMVPNVKNTLEIVNQKGCNGLEKVADAAILEYKLKYDEYPSGISDLVNAGLLEENQTTCDGSKTLVIYDGIARIE